MKYRQVILLSALILLALGGMWKLRATPEEIGRSESSDTAATLAHQKRGSPMVQTTTDHPTPGAVADPASERLPVTDELKLRHNFDALIETIRTTLPTVEGIRQLPGDHHETSPEITDSGRNLGALAKFLEEHPDFIATALPTYLDCARDESIMPATRALCTFRMKYYRKYWNQDLSSAYPKIPVEIRNLADQLAELE